MSRKKILIIEDERVIRSSIRKFLSKQGFKIEEAESIDEARSHKLDQFSLIITDLRLPGAIGTSIIKMAPEVPVLVMTSYASVNSAVDAMKLGAADYIAKPFDYDDLLTTVNELVCQDSEDSITPISGMLGNCEPMQLLFRKIQKVAPTDTNILIQGESGTGKELVAKAIHESSKQADREMISVNCAAIPDSLIESELFGHEKGAFTGAATRRIGLVEAANNSTLFLDEIGELPLDAQARLLRVLQEGEIRRVGAVEILNVNVRLIAATHRNLRELSRNGDFREDLYYRLNVVTLALPPLRDRGSDLSDLAAHFLRLNCEKFAKPALSFSEASNRLIATYRWPGNIRELENAIERAVILCEHAVIHPDLLAIEPDQHPLEALSSDGQGRELSLEDYFKQFVLDNQDRMTETELAQNLGISRKALWQKRQKLNLPRKRSKKK